MDDDSADSESTQIVDEVANSAETVAQPQVTAAAETLAQPQVPQPQGPAPLEAPPVTTAPAGWDAQAAGPAPYYAASPYGFEPVEPVPAKKRNILALLGLILAVPVWPAGLILSALGLFNAISRRTGKVMAIIGLVLSVVTGGAVIAGLAAATSAVAASTALDPGCISVESSLNTDLATLKTDAAALESEKDSASTSSSSIGVVNTDLSAVEGDLATASGDATHSNVKSDLNTMNDQVQTVGKALTAVLAHSTSSDGAAAAALTRLQSTDADLVALCGTY
jgi:hypothetical protein